MKHDKMKQSKGAPNRVWVGLVLLLIAVLEVSAQGKITLKLTDEPLPKALQFIEQQGGKSIVFSVSETEQYRVSVDVHDVPQAKVLNMVLRGKPFVAKEREDYFVVQRLRLGVETFTISGMVVNERHEPMDHCNVLVLDSDSAFVGGVVTDAEGKFMVPLERDEECRLQISFIGYRTINKTCAPGDLGTMVMTANSTRLGEVNVVGAEGIRELNTQEDSLPFVPANNVRKQAAEVIPSINLLAVSNNKKSLAIAGLANVVRKKAFGLQVSGLYNHIGDMGRGVAIAGLANMVLGSYYGAQISGLWNYSALDAKGMMVGGLGNITNGGFDGVQIGGLLNTAKGTNGLQVAGLVNTAKDMNGTQIAGLFNIVNDMNGIQVGGLFNTAKATNGIQIAGLVNTAKDMNGTQIAGLFNIVNDMNGIQVGGLFNTAKATNGIQIAGLVNTATEVNGLQLAGLVNIATKSKGVQLTSILNIAEESDFPIGLINIVKYGEKGVGLTYDMLGNTMVSFRSGGKYTYGILGAGYNLQVKNWVVAEAGYGLHIPVCKWMQINNEVKAIGVANSSLCNFSYMVAPSVTLWEHVNLFGGPSVNFCMAEIAGYGELLSKHTLWSKESGKIRQNLCLGYQVGLQYIF